jgi:hypothetical protein
VNEVTARSNRRTLLLLLLVFLAPALGSWLLYANVAHLHLSTTNKGEFVQPPRLLDTAALGLSQGYFTHHFTLVYVSGPECAADCRAALEVMHATQLALGEQTQQVQRLYLSQGILAADMTQGDPGLAGRDVKGAAVLKGFDGADAPKYIYLVDRNGYVVLRYALAQDPKFLLIDLRHLLGAGEG